MTNLTEQEIDNIVNETLGYIQSYKESYLEKTKELNRFKSFLSILRKVK